MALRSLQLPKARADRLDPRWNFDGAEHVEPDMGRCALAHAWSILTLEQVDRLAAYAAGELHAEERAAFERALERDPDLRAQLAAMRRADAALDAFPAPEPPEGFDDRIDAFVTSVLADTLGGATATSTSDGSEASDPDGPAGGDLSTEPTADQPLAPPSHLTALPAPDGTGAAGDEAAGTEVAGGGDELAARRTKKRGLAPTLGAVAAGLVLLVGGVVVVQTSDILDGPQVDSAFEGTEDSADDTDMQADRDDSADQESPAEGDAPEAGEEATDAEDDAVLHDAEPGAAEEAPAPGDEDAEAESPDDSTDSAETGELFDDESPASTESHGLNDGPLVIADAGELTLSDLDGLLTHDAFEVWDGVNIGDGHEIASDLENWPTGYDVAVDAADAAQAASCFNQFVTSSPASIVTFVAFGSYEGTDAIIFGLLTPDDDQYVYRDVFSVSADSCGLLDFTRNY